MKPTARLMLSLALALSATAAWARPVTAGRTHVDSVHSRAPQGRTYTIPARRS